jgi:DNA helicase-2/ATP-dependent DNA helicase PcrA
VSESVFLEGLNQAQREAVLHGEGPLLVVAGAGSGKTRVLTHRIAYLIGERGVNPSSILAITFTNKAADEMRSRIEGLVGPKVRSMWVSTFHSACVRILRKDADRLGYRKSFTIYDDADSRHLMERVLGDLGFDTKRVTARSVLGEIGRAKAELLDFESYKDQAQDPFQMTVARAYELYQQRLLEASAMDFDDLLMVTVNLFESFPEVLSSYRERFSWVLVDEYQDTNRAQDTLVQLICAEHRNICVVGDSDQSIYGFRGADVRNILQFQKVFPEAKVVTLEQNYRSTQVILDMANAVISNNKARPQKSLWSEVGQGRKALLFRAEDEREEAEWVVGEVLFLATQEHLGFGQMAVFYRTNAQSRAIEEALVAHDVPYRVVGGTRFYDRKEIKDALAYLRLVVNPDDEVSFTRVVNNPPRGIGDKALGMLAAFARSHGGFSAVLGGAEKAGLSGRALKGATALAELLARARSQQESGVAPQRILEGLLDGSGYLEALEAEGSVEAESRLENLAELVNVASGYATLEEMLEATSLMSDLDQLREDARAVTLMTIHAAKGLEFDAVFIVGMEDGIFPHARSMRDPDALEEERRLCYVGITRARKWLYLSHAWDRQIWGKSSDAFPSRFLNEIPKELLVPVEQAVGRAGLGGQPGSLH